MLHVGLTGERFSSIQNALDFLEQHPDEERWILIQPGIYQEKVTIRISDVLISGVSPDMTDKTILTCASGGREILADGKKRGTFRTQTCFVDADKVRLKYLTIENSAGPGNKAGQAIALYADGDRLSVLSCRLLGWQDTLFTAPLPPSEIEKDGFIGPKQHAPRSLRKQYYQDCYIEGEVDFIFGGATAFFENCTFFSKNIPGNIKGYVTAPSTPKECQFGYIMKNCRFVSNCPEKSVFLGRPWREWGKTVLLHCEIGAHITAEGWDDWGKEDAHKHSFFAEFQCSGPGASRRFRPDWVYELTIQEATAYTKESILGNETEQEIPWWQEDNADTK